jgi:single-strand DNA-binding protein
MLFATVTGHVGKDPQIKETRSGKPYATFSLATNEFIKGEKHTTWLNVTVFDEHKVKFVGQSVRKGSALALVGSVKARAWQDQSGETVASLDLTLGWNSFIDLLGGPTAGASRDPAGPIAGPGAAGQERDPARLPAGQEDFGDEVPF